MKHKVYQKNNQCHLWVQTNAKTLLKVKELVKESFFFFLKVTLFDFLFVIDSRQ